MNKDSNFREFNSFVLNSIGIIITVILVNLLINIAYKLNWIPNINCLIKNYLHVITFIIYFLVYLLLRKTILNKSINKMFFIFVSLYIIILNYYKCSLFNSTYKETIFYKSSINSNLYISKIHEYSSFIRYSETIFRVYSSRFPLVKVIRDVRADRIKVKSDNPSIVRLICYSNLNIDTLNISID